MSGAVARCINWDLCHTWFRVEPDSSGSINGVKSRTICSWIKPGEITVSSGIQDLMTGRIWLASSTRLLNNSAPSSRVLTISCSAATAMLKVDGDGGTGLEEHLDHAGAPERWIGIDLPLNKRIAGKGLLR